MEKLTILSLASGLARHASFRHSVIAENVANADTPGYRARSVEDFREAVNREFTLRATRPGHVGAGPGTVAFQAAAAEGGPQAAPNGNSVNIEDQAMQATAANGQHRLATTVYSKVMDILRIGLGPNR
jgi:flagellar basal-body rod protein FlgB